MLGFNGHQDQVKTQFRSAGLSQARFLFLRIFNHKIVEFDDLIHLLC
jgi:hypothetical protein